MPKRLKYFISSIIGAVAFYLYLGLPVESRYYGLMLLLAMVAFCFWFGLGIIFEGTIDTKIMSVLMPMLWTLGFGMFAALLPTNWLNLLLLTLFFGAVLYVMFLAENVFLVAIGYRTVPLYRAAYTVSLILILLVSFFVFNSMFSFMLPFWGNMIITALLSWLIFTYQYWAIAIELPDDGKEKGKWPYILIPTILLMEIAGILSFWPVGIFKGSIYLVAVIYLISGLLQAEIRNRLFRGIVLTYSYIGVAVVLAIILATNWG
ncbi:MAG: hypothetical protein WC503_02485 [Candidatus Shapirobacteria bacterium]